MDKQRFELVFTAGVLIHLEPSKLPSVYEKFTSLARGISWSQNISVHSPMKCCIEGTPGSYSGVISQVRSLIPTRI